MFYANLGQANVQIPWELAGQSQTTIAASINGQNSTPQMVNLAAYSPGVFAINGEGTGRGAPGRQLSPGGFHQPGYRGQHGGADLCTGLGPVSNQPATGAPSPSNPPAKTTTESTVLIGGAPATVQFSGLTPGYAGLYQVNALVPQDAAQGSAVPVEIAIDGVKSNTVTMAIQ